MAAVEKGVVALAPGVVVGLRVVGGRAPLLACTPPAAVGVALGEASSDSVAVGEGVCDSEAVALGEAPVLSVGDGEGVGEGDKD